MSLNTSLNYTYLKLPEDVTQNIKHDCYLFLIIIFSKKMIFINGIKKIIK